MNRNDSIRNDNRIMKNEKNERKKGEKINNQKGIGDAEDLKRCRLCDILGLGKTSNLGFAFLRFKRVIELD